MHLCAGVNSISAVFEFVTVIFLAVFAVLALQYH